MERDRTPMPKAEEIEEEEMDISGHGDKLQHAVDQVADRPEREPEESVRPVEEEDMDTRGHGDPKRDLL